MSISIFTHSHIISLRYLPYERQLSSRRPPAGKDNTLVSHLHLKHFFFSDLWTKERNTFDIDDWEQQYARSVLDFDCALKILGLFQSKPIKRPTSWTSNPFAYNKQKTLSEKDGGGRCSFQTPPISSSIFVVFVDGMLQTRTRHKCSRRSNWPCNRGRWAHVCWRFE